MTDAILEVFNLRKSFGPVLAVSDVSFSMKEGEIIGLLGPNGAGKTTVFYIIAGFLKPNSGSVRLNGVIINNLPMYRRAILGISYLPQESSIFRRMTVEENILAVLEVRSGLSSAARKEKAYSLMDEFGIVHLAKQPAYTLSGGERRRTEIARALAVEPKFLLLDEPFTGIDPIAIREIKSLIHNLSNKGIGILLTDHNVRDTLAITSRAYIISKGTIVANGQPQSIIENPLVRETYLGHDFEM
ncbi:MAG TPA: LPS export ABC transporter ATP-binding protein [Rectinema sp.]|jgi:lipopolysaccharide export system ATP-binding protein|nr:LPS export ABC transporter ATP-binding protein [Spirochaetota bacterium]NLH89699.1 LPS export ABC transporter ATP-binding protein [Treponema sp.]OQC74807.1 MAG: Lipopolysaccharide export system ATP-binding protein LptB [Spirochaetes bacterium ADurb.Bin001]HNP93080.1 LPS export ABC transporter ATP-binding protein [Rectinema sp.]HOC27069.1 LPS export ABC transporter ATP-binding protein [Rectinema sp.]